MEEMALGVGGIKRSGSKKARREKIAKREAPTVFDDPRIPDIPEDLDDDDDDE